MTMKIQKNKVCAMRIHGKYVMAWVLEIGAKQITVFNMDTQRVNHIPVKQPKVKPVVESPVVAETTAVMNSIMETATPVEKVMELLNKIM